MQERPPTTDEVRHLPAPRRTRTTGPAMRVIHWFRSDLRIADNTALTAACRGADALAPVFVLDDAQLARHRDAHPRLRFLDASIRDLAVALEAAGSRLIVLRGAPHRCLPSLARACGASLVTWNRDYGPYAKERDRRVRDALAHDGVEVRTFKDRVVFEGAEIRSTQGRIYSVYTHFRRVWWRQYQAAPPRAVPRRWARSSCAAWRRPARLPAACRHASVSGRRAAP